MKASVSREVLIQVRNALCRFEMDINGMSAKAERYAQETLGQGHLYLIEAKKDVEEGQVQVNRLKDELARLDYDIGEAEGQFKKSLQLIGSLNGQIASVDAQIRHARSQLGTAQAQAGREPDRNYDAQIASLNNQIAQLEGQRAQLQKERGEQEAEREKWNSRRTLLRQQKGDCIGRLNDAQRVLDQRRQKEQNLQSAFNRMAGDLREYVGAVCSLEQNSTSAAQRNLSAVQKCIRSIEKYLSTSL